MDEEGSEVTHDGASSSASSSPARMAVGSREYHQREQSLAAYGLDIHSCLHFLLDLYSQWMSPQVPLQHTTDIFVSKTPLSLLTEVTRSVSNYFCHLLTIVFSFSMFLLYNSVS